MKKRDRTIALCGAGGFIGSHLATYLCSRGHTVVAVERALLAPGAAEQLAEVLATCDTVVCVTGTTINRRWSDKYKHTLYESRTGVVKRLVKAIGACENVDTFVSASAVGIYPSEGCYDEYSEIYGDDFLARLCRSWEAEAHRAPQRIRTIITRYGVVLSPHGGAFVPMARPARMGIGAILGNGCRPFTWIDLRDLCRAVEFLIRSELDGTFNLVAPEKLTQRKAAQLISAHYKARFTIPVPAFLFRMLRGEATDVLLKGQCAEPARLLASGFEFGTPSLENFLCRLEK